MNGYEFVFSVKRPARYFRHTAFWIIWGGFFIGTTYSGRTVAGGLLFLLIHLSACYAFLYIVLRRFLMVRSYMRLAAGIIAISACMIAAGYFAAYDERGGRLWSGISNGLLSAQKVIGVAAIIKLLKGWWLQQKEKERLEREKADAELELLKARIHPAFLFSTLNNIYGFSLISSPKSPEMLLKLSDILSYMLYECNDVLVPLEKEIGMLRDYMALEGIRYGDRMEMNMRVNGDTDHQLISPLLLLHFVENGFRHCDEVTGQAWLSMEIVLEEGVLYMKLFHSRAVVGRGVGTGVGRGAETDSGTGVGTGSQADGLWLEAVRKRLQWLYPGDHVLKIIEDPEIFIVNLRMKLVVRIPERGNRDLVYFP